jgi:hypothetical protein
MHWTAAAQAAARVVTGLMELAEVIANFLPTYTNTTMKLYVSISLVVKVVWELHIFCKKNVSMNVPIH